MSSQDTTSGGGAPSTGGVQIHVSQERERRVEITTPTRLSLQNRVTGEDNNVVDWKPTVRRLLILEPRLLEQG